MLCTLRITIYKGCLHCHKDDVAPKVLAIPGHVMALSWCSRQLAIGKILSRSLINFQVFIYYSF